MVSTTVPARVGLAGNPSDAYGGATLAVPLPALTATVTLEPATTVRVGARSWASPAALAADPRRYDADPGDRLVAASITVVAGRIVDPPAGDGFAVRWSTTIPQSVGLAGSSAIVVATIRALDEHWSLALGPDDVAALALAAERDELGIAAGWQDRMVQAHRVPVLVDARTDPPSVRPLRPGAPFTLFAAWDERAAAPSGDIHAALRARHDGDGGDVAGAMRDLARQADHAAEAFVAGDLAALTAAVDATCTIRDRIGALTPPTRRLVDAARRAGVVATSAGSGGSIAGVVEASAEAALRAAMHEAGARLVTFTPG